MRIESIDPGRFDWSRIEHELDARGGSVLGTLLSPAECAALTFFGGVGAEAIGHI